MSLVHRNIGDNGHIADHNDIVDVLTSLATPATSVTDVTSGSGVVGTAATYSRGDHQHGGATVLGTPQMADVATLETTVSATYTDLTTSGPAVTVTIGASGRCLVVVSAGILTGTNAVDVFMSFTDGTYGPNDADAIVTRVSTNRMTASRETIVTGLSAGSHTFTAKYKSNGTATATFERRRIVALPL